MWFLPSFHAACDVWEPNFIDQLTWNLQEASRSQNNSRRGTIFRRKMEVKHIVPCGIVRGCWRLREAQSWRIWPGNEFREDFVKMTPLWNHFSKIQNHHLRTVVPLVPPSVHGPSQASLALPQSTNNIMNNVKHCVNIANSRINSTYKNHPDWGIH